MILELYLRYLNKHHIITITGISDFVKIIENNIKTYFYVQNMIPYFCIFIYIYIYIYI